MSHTGMQALVLELVEGPTQADRIARGRIPLEEALPMATQIADALAAAHARGISTVISRPAKIKVRPDGSVKVLDFGLAKAVAKDVDQNSASWNPVISWLRRVDELRNAA